MAIEVGAKLKALRNEQKLTQGDIERITGLQRAYVSRVESGQTVPTLDTLEKFCYALGTPLWKLFFEGNGQPKRFPFPETEVEIDEDDVTKLAKFMPRINDWHRSLLLRVAFEMTRRKNGTNGKKKK